MSPGDGISGDARPGQQGDLSFNRSLRLRQSAGDAELTTEARELRKIRMSREAATECSSGWSEAEPGISGTPESRAPAGATEHSF